MSERILFVDDEPNILQSIKRNLRKQFNLDIAEGGQQALQLMSSSGPYAVVVSDMKMPGMDGVEFLSEAKRQAPETVRMMLTGNADQETAVAAVNEGDVFRFLNKPCEPEKLAEAVNLALSHHRLITAERDLLENTLRGSLRAMVEVLALTSPEIFGRTTRFKTYMGKLAEEMGIGAIWSMETVALLSQIGCVSITESIVKHRTHGKPLLPDELKEFYKHTTTGAKLISVIPRMGAIAKCISYQEKHFDGSGYPEDDCSGDKIPLGARLLKVIIDFDAYEIDADNSKALARLKRQAHFYDPAVLAAFEIVLEKISAVEEQTIKIHDLKDGMILTEDVITYTDAMLVSKGQETTESVRRHLNNFLEKNMIPDTVMVWQDVN